MNACPVVCMTALAISKLARFRRAMISRHTPAHASGPAFLHWSCARLAAASSASRSDFGIRDAERHAERRLLRADVADGAGLRQRKALAEQRVERGLAGLRRAFAIILGAGRLRKRAPVAALADGLHRAVEHGAVAFEQGVGQGELLWFSVSLYQAERRIPLRRRRLGYPSATARLPSISPQLPVWSKSIVTLSVTG